MSTEDQAPSWDELARALDHYRAPRDCRGCVHLRARDGNSCVALAAPLGSRRGRDTAAKLADRRILQKYQVAYAALRARIAEVISRGSDARESDWWDDVAWRTALKPGMPTCPAWRRVSW